MSNHRAGPRGLTILASCIALACAAQAQAQQLPAQEKTFAIAPQALGQALIAFSDQADVQVVTAGSQLTHLLAPGVSGRLPPEQALQRLLADSGLRYRVIGPNTVAVTDAAQAASAVEPPTPPQDSIAGKDPEAVETQPATASQDTPQTAPTITERNGKDATTFDTIVVTAQKKVENIQKVPIAISAFGGEDLNDRKIETGGDLVTAVPNVSFSKTNFASYNFQIRGIGTQALSVTTDPAVAISFNSSPMIRNRLFEQEYFDVERVEVLRGPQGTLYGRNATAGVVNMLPNIADPGAFEANAKGEFGSYDTTRVNAMVNVPLSDAFAFRVATQYTKRDGYDYNTVTRKDVNDRDLLSVRTSLAWKPSDKVSSSLVWEHFQEDDMRARTGKQLCHNDPGPASIGAQAVRPKDRGFVSQGCVDGSLYDDGAFGVPNGASLPFVLAASAAGGIVGFRTDDAGNFGVATLIPSGTDPYAGVTQSRDLRELATTYDPKFEATNDVAQFNLDIGIGDHLNIVSQSLYTRDQYYSTQDYGRFQSNPIFTNTSSGVFQFLPDFTLAPAYDLAPGGVYCDPQLGCSDRLLTVDLVDADSRQWSQEFRLQSSYDGPFNFNIGANYLDYEIDESYYFFSNVLTALAQTTFNSGGLGGRPADCAEGSATTINGPEQGSPCVYIDPNSLRGINGQGHNYFRSRNVAQTRSAAVFGEGYFKLSDTLRLTAGLRWTRDVKTTTPVPSQLLLAATQPPIFTRGGGYVGYGYPEGAEIRQTWSEPTGRLVLDWSPDLSFTDSTLLYASASRGYKAGGTNSPGIGADPQYLFFEQRNPEFRAEYVNALELGMKNVMAGGAFVFNATAFYNDYTDYQISQIQDRATLNENFDAKTWGAELEAVWRPSAAFQLSGNVGLLRTRLGDNQSSIDVLDRTAGNADWVAVRPWLQLASNCIAPKALVETALTSFYAYNDESTLATPLNSFCSVNTPFSGGGFTADQGFGGGPGDWAYLLNGQFYNPQTDGPNGGAGFAKNVGGNELPNAPHLTVSLSPQYTFGFGKSDLTLRADLYYQTKSWARVYQDRIDRLDAWGNVNLSLTWHEPDNDLTVQLYVKNALDDDSITGTFINSDDTGLTTNAFLMDPRIIGLSVRKGFF